jgi:hypothetical protein
MKNQEMKFKDEIVNLSPDYIRRKKRIYIHDNSGININLSDKHILARKIKQKYHSDDKIKK